MNIQDYKQKLIEWNTRQHYQAELDFLIMMVDPQPDELILDYGAGIGTAWWAMKDVFGADAYGFDITRDLWIQDPKRLLTSLSFYFKKVYFMHSFAHIQDPELALRILADKHLKNEGEVIIVTPNKDWLQEKGIQSTDPTVVAHYNIKELTDILARAGAYQVEQSFPPEELGLDLNARLWVKARFNQLRPTT